MDPRPPCSLPVHGSNARSCVVQQETVHCSRDQLFASATDQGLCLDCAPVAVDHPGFICEDGKLVPCPVGFYCTVNETENLVHQHNCTDDQLCLLGFDAPLDCPWGSRCNGSKVEMGEEAIVVLVLLGVAMATLVCVLMYRKARLLRKSTAAMALHTDEPTVIGEDFIAEVPAVDISFSNVALELRSTGKMVLSGITGSFPAGCLVALMGPSGGGKTTFMNALLGRASYGHVTGDILTNGVEGDLSRLPSLVGFVPQDDVVHANLTVYENLLYNALLRLPRTHSKATKVKLVVQTMRAIGITHIKDSLVGDASRRGISGGQKKRVNIGMELVAMPAVMFMDEPTSGLDGAATVQLAQCLSHLSSSGLSIICVIHQPRFSVFTQFSHLLLLGAGGRQVYSGLSTGVMPYLSALGFRMPEGENVADWMIDVVSGLSPRYGEDGEVDGEFEAPADLFDAWEAEALAANQIEGPASGLSRAILRHAKQHAVPEAQGASRAKFVTRWDEGFTEPPALAGRPREPLQPRKGLRRLKQAYYLASRSLRQHHHSFFVGACLALFLNGTLFSSMLSSQQDYNYALIIPWLTGGTGGAPLFTLIIASYARPFFATEKLNFYREAKSGISAFAYWLAKNVHLTLLLPILTAAFTVACFLFTVPLQPYGTFFAVYLCTAWYWSGAGLLVASAVDGELPTTLILIFWPLFEPILEGFRPIGTTVRESPLSFVTCGRWLHQALFASEVMALPTHIQNYTVITDELDDRRMDGTQLHQHYNDALLILLGWGAAFRLLALICIAKLKYLDSWCSPFPMAWRILQRVSFLLLDRGSVDESVDPDAAKAEVELANVRPPRMRPGQRSQVIWDGQRVRMLQRANTMGNVHQNFPEDFPSQKRVVRSEADSGHTYSAKSLRF